VLAGRSPEKHAAVLETCRAAGVEAALVEMNLGSLASVRRAADEILKAAPAIHALINNAGVGGAQGVTEDGFEVHFGVNHLGHFLLTRLLLDRIKASAPTRVVNVSSGSHYEAKGIDFEAVRKPTRSISGVPEYSVSKLANVLFSAELGRKLAGSGVTTYSLHPGVIASDAWRRMPWPVRPIIKLFMRSVEEGALTPVWCATAAELANETGLYYSNRQHKTPSGPAQDIALAKELWAKSDEWTSPFAR
jgi:NAD(P)-dependent dehydrogenase (short-subunit alcohol dehydrogenase family)